MQELLILGKMARLENHFAYIYAFTRSRNKESTPHTIYVFYT